MFQVATVIAHAIRMNTTYSFPTRSGKRDQFPFMFPHLPRQPEFYSTEIYRENEFGIYHPLPELSNLHLNGYFQSEKYFKEHKEYIIKAFGFSVPKVVRDKRVAVHVRRGDYVRLHHKHNVLDKYWIEMAMDMFPEPYQFHFYSDDIDWCVHNFATNPRCHFVYNNNPKEAMISMSCTEHGIMSPSSFSWWANWIAENNGKDRKVIVPKDWFNPNYTKLRTDDIVPEHWIKL